MVGDGGGGGGAMRTFSILCAFDLDCLLNIFSPSISFVLVLVPCALVVFAICHSNGKFIVGSFTSTYPSVLRVHSTVILYSKNIANNFVLVATLIL